LCPTGKGCEHGRGKGGGAADGGTLPSRNPRNARSSFLNADSSWMPSRQLIQFCCGQVRRGRSASPAGELTHFSTREKQTGRHFYAPLRHVSWYPHGQSRAGTGCR
jgi:hypothetical protein